MILKLEPGAYLEEHGGVRNSDMVAVTQDGAELLTPFHRDVTEVTLKG
jgi:Xaa-Pro aminopeptidase